VVVSFLLLSNPIVSDQTGNHHFILTTNGTLPGAGVPDKRGFKNQEQASGDQAETFASVAGVVYAQADAPGFKKERQC